MADSSPSTADLFHHRRWTGCREGDGPLLPLARSIDWSPGMTVRIDARSAISWIQNGQCAVIADASLPRSMGTI
jgi:hypothetical protein